MIINCGIKEVIFIDDYEDDNSKKMLAMAGIKIRKLVI
jgi:deoxycytidylate deaminase